MSTDPGNLGILSAICFDLDLTLHRGSMSYITPWWGACSMLQMQPSCLVRYNCAMKKSTWSISATYCLQCSPLCIPILFLLCHTFPI